MRFLVLLLMQILLPLLLLHEAPIHSRPKNLRLLPAILQLLKSIEEAVITATQAALKPLQWMMRKVTTTFIEDTHHAVPTIVTTTTTITITETHPLTRTTLMTAAGMKSIATVTIATIITALAPVNAITTDAALKRDAATGTETHPPSLVATQIPVGKTHMAQGGVQLGVSQ